jgi:uncharacterized protein
MSGFVLFSILASLATAQIEPAVFAVPPPVEQYTADCARPVYASDQLVCSDAELRSLDDRLALLLKDKPMLAQRSGSDFYEAQPAWFKRRSVCAMQVEHRACLAAAYEERIRVIEVVGTNAPVQSRPKRCKLGKRPDAITLFKQRENEVFIASSRNEIIGVAQMPLNTTSWQPFLRYSTTRSSVLLSNISNSIGKCRTPN